MSAANTNRRRRNRDGSASLSCAIAGCLVGAIGGTMPVLAKDGDSRLRTVAYSDDEVYRLRGYVGYQIDLEFEPEEAFVGMGAGDVAGLAFAAQANHLFIKPKAVHVHTNLTVLTTRRSYHFDYTAGPDDPDPDHQDVIYVLRFAYPAAIPVTVPPPQSSTMTMLAMASETRPHNMDYWYCGRSELQPLEVWDDGVHTHLKFNARGELPAVFVRNDDGSESLLNFNVEHGEIVVHRTARRFVLRRGRLTGCVVNNGFEGSGVDLSSGTLAPDIERATREPQHEAVR